MKHITYPKIPQFRTVISNINNSISFVGLDKNGDPIYDQTIPKPTLKFKGTVKLHGTNASVCFNSKSGFWIQSRNNIITIEKDNAGFAFFAENRKIEFCSLLDKISNHYQIDTHKFTISIYGEWAGKGIQKGVGISQLEKAFYIFGIKISSIEDENFNSYWLESSFIRNTENNIYNVNDFKTYVVDVDFNNPAMSQNEFIKITEAVEKECPIAKAFGIENGIGEGVVWTTNYKDSNYKFKVKGGKHSVTKVKKLASVNIEKMKSIQDFVEYSVTQNRYNQAIENVFNGEDIDIKKMGDLLRWVVKDIMSEEMDTMKDNGLEPKDVNKFISQKVKEIFFKQLKQL